MQIFEKVKASALQYALVASVLIAIIIFAFISLVYLQQKLQVKDSFYKEAIENVNSGIDYFSKNDILYSQIQEHQFSDNSQETTILQKKHWGIFDIAIVKSDVKNEHFEKIALLGNNHPNRDALYLQETNKPLVVVGNTKITGNISLPKQGIKTGNISGVSYYGNQLFYGKKKQSSESFPKIRNLKYIVDISRETYNDSVIYFELEDSLVKRQLFSSPVAVYESSSSIFLRSIALQGNIIIRSDKIIQVDASSKLEDVILIAPEIQILDNIVGNFQCFASKKINIGKNCKLNYPSSFVLISKDTTNNTSEKKEENSIFIAENTDLKGSILFYKEEEYKNPNFNPQIIISKNTTITGEVYCNKSTELLGSVFGSVYTQNFITKQNGSIYVNHILNGIINSEKLPKPYCGLPIENIRNHRVAKWLY